MIVKVYIFVIIGICIITVIKSTGSKMSFPLSVVCSMSILISAVPFWSKIIALVNISENVLDDMKSFLYIPLILLTSEYLSSICNDMGEKSLAESITVFTKTFIIASVMSMLSGIVDIIKGLTG